MGLYRNLAGVRVPRLIQPLCTPRITALTEERGIKVTNAAARLSPARRRQVGGATRRSTGGLPSSFRPGELTIIDWALRERLSRDQRRHLALLFAMIDLRDALGTCNEVLAPSQQHIRSASPRGQMIADTVTRFLDELPAARGPSMLDVMRHLERIALTGVKFPGSLIVLSKVMFTLDGILRDVGASDTGMNATVARHLAQHWLSNRKAFRSLLMTGDWITLQCRALLYTARLWMHCEQTALDRLLPTPSTAPLASA
jgi:ubiquinone biosynthesis protein